MLNQVSRKQDPSTGANHIIDQAHIEVHEGAYFGYCDYQSALANNGYIRFFIQPDVKEAHLLYLGSCGGDALIKIFEAPTVDPEGTLQAPRNRNRVFVLANSGVEGNTTIVKLAPTVSDTGLRLEMVPILSGTGGVARGGVGGNRDEHILTHGKTYLLEIQNLSGQARKTALNMAWYEQIPRE